MNKIDQQLATIQQEKRMGLMTHVVVGYPSLKATEELVLAMDKAGVDFVELQIPFSDPLADGPTIMRACEQSLENGTKVKDAFTIAQELSKVVRMPLLFMGYYNTVFKYGVEKFCNDAKRVGISGMIIPDMPLEEEASEQFIACTTKHGLYAIRVISPSATEDRLQKNARVAKGFVYCTARQGTTDAKKGLDPKIASYLKRVRKTFAIPVAVGFGISSKERVDLIRGHADIAVVGSAIIDVINAAKGKDIVKEVTRFIASLEV